MPQVVRPPAVAGSFYPASAGTLSALVDRLLAGASPVPPGPCPKALIVPHAGYVYSGPIAASAFALLAPHAATIERIVLLGPAHTMRVAGLVSPDATRMATPLGEITVDQAALDTVPEVAASRAAHAREHSLEVELPFVQRVVPRARIVPLAVGHARPEEVAHVLRELWGGPETVVLISSDLSHYMPYDTGRELDVNTAARIVALATEPLDGEQACGAAGINGLLAVARERGLRAELVDLRSSGDTAGPRGEVVGYGAFAFYEVAL